MTRALSFSLLAATALALGACSQTSGVDDDEPTANGSATVAKQYEGVKPEGVSSPQDAVTTTFYIPQAAISDMYEIEAGEMALARGRDERVKAFARQMIEDHRKSSAKLRQFVADNPVNIAIPQNIDARRKAMLSNLQSAADAEFDAVYIGQQAAAHDEAFNLHSSYANKGDYPALKQLAAAMVPVITHHREEAKALDGSIGPSR